MVSSVINYQVNVALKLLRNQQESALGKARFPRGWLTSSSWINMVVWFTCHLKMVFLSAGDLLDSSVQCLLHGMS